MKVEVYTNEGKKSTAGLTLNPEVFGVRPNLDLIAQYIRVYLANQRQGTSSSKGRGEVSGGGRKPWRQKGTGRARHGSSRSPIWVGGGVTHGPRPKDWTRKMPKQMRKKALFSALSQKQVEGQVVILKDLSLKKFSTKGVFKVLKNLPLGKSVLVVLPGVDTKIVRSLGNISGVATIQAKDLNAYVVSNFETLIILQKSLSVIEETFCDAIAE